ncbi:MAG TPA: TetR/AcrR family transcriptional regulator [Sphingomonadaceae bacterium]|nr:TetR/AcrR family transcriptional regulator [Sphingomonadaceae bacterium]
MTDLLSSSNSPAGRRSGRSRDTAKRDAILESAHSLFFQRGVEGTTIEDVAAGAGVSKVTVYGHFGDKLTLFEACVRRAVAMMEQGLIQSPPRGDSLRECLFAMGVPLLRFLTSAELIAFDRSLSVEAVRHPELARRFFEAGPYHCRAKLAELIAAGRDRGEVVIDNPIQGAEDLINLWYGMLHKELAMGRIPSPGTAEIDRRVQHGIQVFMRAYGAR